MNILEDYKRTRQKLFDAAGIQPQSKIVSTNGAIKMFIISKPVQASRLSSYTVVVDMQAIGLIL